MHYMYLPKNMRKIAVQKAASMSESTLNLEKSCC